VYDLSSNFTKALENYELPKVSIIVLNYNGKKYLDPCLSSLLKINYPRDKLEVIVVDNGSTDGSVEYIKEKYPWVKLIRLNKNYGYAIANNVGAKFSKGKFLVFLNNDTAVDKNWLIELIKVAIQNPNVILTSKALFFHKPDTIEWNGSKITLIGRAICPNIGEKDKQLTEKRYTLSPYGASMLVGKEIFEKLGGFDGDYFISYEDKDLGLRAWLMGYSVVYVSTSVFYHVGGGTGGRGKYVSDILIFHSVKNSYMNIIKYFDITHIVLGVIFSLMFNIYFLLKFATNGRINHAKMITLAHVWLLLNSKNILKKRIVLNYEAKRKRRFLFNDLFYASFREAFEVFRRKSSLTMFS